MNPGLTPWGWHPPESALSVQPSPSGFFTQTTPRSLTPMVYSAIFLAVQKLSRRERQIIDILYARGRASSAEVQAALPDPPSYSATRALLRILEEKGHVRHEADGPRYVFAPSVPRDRARRSALKHLLETFFDNSATDAVAALLDSKKLRPEELDRMEQMIEQVRKERKS